MISKYVERFNQVRECDRRQTDRPRCGEICRPIGIAGIVCDARSEAILPKNCGGGFPPFLVQAEVI